MMKKNDVKNFCFNVYSADSITNRTIGKIDRRHTHSFGLGVQIRRKGVGSEPLAYGGLADSTNANNGKFEARNKILR